MAPTKTVPYTPVKASLADRVCTWFHQSSNRGEERTAAELARQFSVGTPRIVTNELGGAVQAGWLVFTQGEKSMVYKAGPQLGVVTAAPAAPPPKTAVKRSFTPLPAIDLSTVVVRLDVPLPEASLGPKRSSRYAAVLDKLEKVGASVLLPIQYRAALGAAVKKYAEAKNRKFAIRTVDPQHCGVWRTA